MIDIMKFFGILKDINWNERERNMKKLESHLIRNLTRNIKHFENISQLRIINY